MGMVGFVSAAGIVLSLRTKAIFRSYNSVQSSPIHTIRRLVRSKKPIHPESVKRTKFFVVFLGVLFIAVYSLCPSHHNIILPGTYWYPSQYHSYIRWLFGGELFCESIVSNPAGCVPTRIQLHAVPIPKQQTKKACSSNAGIAKMACSSNAEIAEKKACSRRRRHAVPIPIQLKMACSSCTPIQPKMACSSTIEPYIFDRETAWHAIPRPWSPIRGDG